MQIRARVLLQQTETLNMYFSYVAIILGATVLVWTITSQGLGFYSNYCNADP